jgi:hypothetical protein
VQAITDVPLCIDSSVTGAIEAALEVVEGRPLINSTTGEDEKMEAILPLVAKYKLPVVAISNDETGISEDPDVRFEVARKIVQRAADHGIPAHDIVVDPLVMPVGAMATAGQQVFALVRRLREELGVNTTCGASNISFGLPHRHGINAAFLPMAIGAGMTSAIMNPVRPVEMEAIRAANFLMNHDPNGGGNGSALRASWTRWPRGNPSRKPRPRRRPRGRGAAGGRGGGGPEPSAVARDHPVERQEQHQIHRRDRQAEHEPHRRHVGVRRDADHEDRQRREHRENRERGGIAPAVAHPLEGGPLERHVEHGQEEEKGFELHGTSSGTRYMPYPVHVDDGERSARRGRFEARRRRSSADVGGNPRNRVTRRQQRQGK